MEEKLNEINDNLKKIIDILEKKDSDNWDKNIKKFQKKSKLDQDTLDLLPFGALKRLEFKLQIRFILEDKNKSTNQKLDELYAAMKMFNSKP